MRSWRSIPLYFLLIHMTDDPQAWGYELLNPKETNTSLIRLVPTSPDAFQLHMIGKPDTQPMIFPPVLLPPEYLENDGTQKVLPGEHASVIQIHSDTNYPEFYQLIASMVSDEIFQGSANRLRT